MNYPLYKSWTSLAVIDEVGKVILTTYTPPTDHLLTTYFSDEASIYGGCRGYYTYIYNKINLKL